MLKYLVFKKDGEDGPDVKGGELDALIVHASKVQKICENGKLKTSFFVWTITPFLTTAHLQWTLALECTCTYHQIHI